MNELKRFLEVEKIDFYDHIIRCCRFDALIEYCVRTKM